MKQSGFSKEQRKRNNTHENTTSPEDNQSLHLAPSTFFTNPHNNYPTAQNLRGNCTLAPYRTRKLPVSLILRTPPLPL
ncbi:unnamed protein product [Sphenostylis stenocarpa]|uniref:Uncharacterized protein n=1 Tax=Sphenostylis stenocarpa TaxID=92480 RepID=A0AA86RN96_9FABA|nr:unnamed protein product [Sphenostylis stenocarpa]